MAINLDIVASEALLLPEDQRLALASRILSSVEPAVNADAEAAWDMEIRERIHRYDAGETKSIPAIQVFKELDKRFGQ
jgi:putative addiction module component (TIGR02574 family)